MSSPLIERLIESPDILQLTTENRDQILNASGTFCLFFTENPAKFPESNDVAVVLPELLQALPGVFTAVVVDRAIERELKEDYGFRTWPALVFIRDGQYLGTLEKIRDWSDYMEDIPEILSGNSRRAPGIGIPVTTEISRGER